MTFEVTGIAEQRLQQLAEQSHRSSEDLAQEVLNRYLLYRQELEESVQLGRDAILAGDLIDHDDAMSQLDEVVRHG